LFVNSAKCEIAFFEGISTHNAIFICPWFVQEVVDIEHEIILLQLHYEGRLFYGIFIAQVTHQIILGMTVIPVNCEMILSDTCGISRHASFSILWFFKAQFVTVRWRASRLLTSLDSFLHLFWMQRCLGLWPSL
jgi:hypothetical protein